MRLGAKSKGSAGGTSSVPKKPLRSGKKAAPLKEKSNKQGSAKPLSKGGGKKFVLIVGDEGAILIFLNGRKVLRRLFAPSPQPSHTEAFVEIIAANPTVPIYMLLDVLDQQYVPQPFPPVSSLSIAGLVKRRLDRDFQPDDLKGALQIGRDKTGRKEWRYLLVSVAKSPLLADWMDRIIEQPNELKGIYLSPIESIGYIQAIRKKVSDDKPKPWQLLISHNKVSGFRQVVTHEGRLVFTRVSQAIDDAIPAVISGNIEQEIINTLEYLKRLDFRDNSLLEASVIVSQDVIESLDLKRFGFASADALSPYAVAEKLGLEQAALSADRFGDVVMAAAFGLAKKQSLRFSNSYLDRLAKLYKLRLGIKSATILCVLSMVLMSAIAAFDIVTDYGTISDSERKASMLRGDLDKERSKTKGLNQDVAFKTSVVAAYEAYVKNVRTPEEFMRMMMPTLSKSQRVLGISWKHELAAQDTQDLTKNPSAAKPIAEDQAIAVEMTVDFSGDGLMQDVVNKAATLFTTALSEKLVGYTVTPPEYPWLKEAADTQKQESLEALSSLEGTPVKDPKVKYSIKGVKKVPEAPDSQPGSPPAPVGTP